MRVVIVYNSSWYVFLLRRNLIASLIQAGHTVTVVAPEDAYTTRVKNLGVSFIPISMTRSGTSVFSELSVMMQVRAALRLAQPDTVLSFTAKCNLYVGLCKYEQAFRHVANISGLGQLFDAPRALVRLARVFYKISLAHTECVFFQNRDDLACFVENNMVAATRTTLLPGSGVDLKRFTPVSRLRREHRAFLMFGRLLPKKGFYHFLEAARRLTAQYGDRVVFWILGAADQERGESMALRDAILEAHAEGIVRYLHSTDDPLPFIREADVVVLPSTYNEGVPRSLLEALACGKPVVTTDWKGCRETIENGKNGFLVAPGSVESLIRALDQLITLGDDVLEAFGARSRAIAEARFDESLVITEYHKALAPKARVQSQVVPFPAAHRGKPVPSSSTVGQSLS